MSKKKVNLFLAFLFPTFAGWNLQSFVEDLPSQNSFRDQIPFLSQHYEARQTIPALYVRELDEAKLPVQVLEFPDKLKAFGFYSRLRSPHKKFVQIGAEGFLSSSELVFWKENFCVILHFPGEHDDKKGILLSLGQKISSQISGGADEPDLALLFPEKGLVPHSVVYEPKNILGIPGIVDGFVALYQGEEGKRAVFLSQFSDQDGSKQALEQVKSFFEQQGLVPEKGPFKKENFFVGRKSENRYFFLRHGIYLIGFFPAPSEPIVGTSGREIQKNLNRRELEPLP